MNRRADRDKYIEEKYVDKRKRFPREIQRLKRQSYWILFAEEFGLRFWRLLSWLMGFAALWLLNIPQLFGEFGHVAIAFIALAGIAYFIRKDVRHFKKPTEEYVLRRIEGSSAVTHRPLTSLHDTPIDKQQTALWQREQARKQTLLASLKAAKNRNILPKKDPYALRLAALLALFCGLIVAGTAWKARILSGVLPVPPSIQTQFVNTHVSLWVTPPEYTKVEQLVLSGEQEAPLDIPQGSVLKAFLKNDLGAWTMLFFKPSVQFGDEKFEMVKNEDGTFSLETAVPKTDSLTLNVSWLRSQSWDVNYIPDLPPSISTTEEQKTLSDSQLQFMLSLYDDYSVERLEMRMELDPVVEDAPLGEAIEMQRSVLSPTATDFQMSPVYDMTAHTWAGLPVVFKFTAVDHIGQTGTLEPIKMVLPEREFTHPIAKKLIELRKYMVWNPESSYRDAFIAVEGLKRLPKSFNHDTRVYLSLSVMSARMKYHQPSIETSMSLISMLWDTALRLEDGDLSLAARDLREAQQALEEALQDPNITEEEITRLMQDLREAMAQYMQSLAREFEKRMAEQGLEIPTVPPEMLQDMMDMEDFAQMMQQMEQDMLNGDRSAAQDMLSRLERMMDMMNPSMEFSMPQDMQTMQQCVNELQQLIERQEDLRDQTAKQADLMRTLEGLGMSRPDQGNEPPPFINTEENMAEQEALRYILGQLMLEADQKLDEIPENMALAEQAMRMSSQELESNRPDTSVPYQDEAIEHLKEAQKQMQQQLQQRMKQMMGFSMARPAPGRMDPLGRPYGNDNDENGPPLGSQVEVPDEAEKKWVQDILNELRRRAGQRERPQEELEYYRRLLKRF